MQTLLAKSIFQMVKISVSLVQQPLPHLGLFDPFVGCDACDRMPVDWRQDMDVGS